MRKIVTSDVFKLARIIKKANAKEELKEIFRVIEGQEDSEDAQREAGMELVAFLLDACGDEEIEKCIYDLLGGIAEKKPDEIKNQSIYETMDMLKKIAKENDLQNFFSVAVKSA